MQRMKVKKYTRLLARILCRTTNSRTSCRSTSSNRNPWKI